MKCECQILIFTICVFCFYRSQPVRHTKFSPSIHNLGNFEEFGHSCDLVTKIDGFKSRNKSYDFKASTTRIRNQDIGQRFSHESLVTPTLLRSCTKIITVTLVQIQYNISSSIKLIVTKIDVWERRILLES